MISFYTRTEDPYSQYGIDHFIQKFGIPVTMNQPHQSGIVITYGAEATGDFVISRLGGSSTRRIALEVGGASKRRKGSDFVIRDDLDFPTAAALPLWMLGMMY